jgi:hypothetical protein
MPAPAVIFFGDFSEERIAWETVADHLGWSVHCVPDFDLLAEISVGHEVTAVFVDHRAQVINQETSDAMSLRRIRALIPGVRLVLCCPIRFIFEVDPSEVGAFHAIARPFQMEELRASVGFVWEAWVRKKAESGASAAA